MPLYLYVFRHYERLLKSFLMYTLFPFIMEDFKNPILSELFDEIEELNTSLRELSNDDLIDCKTALINRTNRAINLINELNDDFISNFTPSDNDLKNSNLL